MKSSRRQFISSLSRATMGFAVGSVVPTLGWAQRQQRHEYLERSVLAMGTTVVISAFGESRSHILHATSRAFDELYRMDRLLSVYRQESDVSRLNASAGEREIEVDSVTKEILVQAQKMHSLTKGAFDITVEPLMRVYGFRSDSKQVHAPSSEELQQARSSVGMERIRILNGDRIVIEDRRTNIDLGGIAVGFTVDRMVKILRKEGIESALINHSGDVFALGSPMEMEGWPVAISDPSNPDETLTTLELQNQAASTSGNYRSFREIQEGRIGHIVDPRTGRNPSEFESITVIATTSLEADALSTGLFVHCDVDGKWRSDQRRVLIIQGKTIRTIG